nr:hypothetical protein [uncultured Roseateles sp.]
MSDPTHRFFSAAKAIRLLVLVLGSGLFTLPAMAAKDCWTLWTPHGPGAWYDGSPQGRDAHLNCRDSLEAAGASFWTAMMPLVSQPEQYPEFTSVTKVTPGACSITVDAQAPTRWGVGVCQYTYTTTTTPSNPNNPPGVLRGESFIEFLMTCGRKLNTTPIGATVDTCKGIKDEVASPVPSCSVSNPIEPLTGLKRQPEALFSWGRGHSLSASYWSAPKSGGTEVDELGANSFGPYWSSNLHRQMITEYRLYLFQRGLGIWKNYPQYGYNREATERDPKPALSADGSVWLYRDETARAIETYQLDGSLVSIAYIDGRRLDFSGSLNAPGAATGSGKYLVQSVVDEAGRRVSFNYRDAQGQRYASIGSIVDPAGAILPIGYDAIGNLTSITYADQSSRRFLYENAAFPHAMTGRLDEGGERLGSYVYDEQGRVISSATGSEPPWTIQWPVPPEVRPVEYYDPEQDVVIRLSVNVQPTQAVVKAPDGRESTWTGTTVGRATLVGSRSQPAGAGCAASTSSSAFDAAGNVTRSDDFNGNRSCMAYDAARKLEVTRIEGVSSAMACESVSAAALPAGARMISSQWHPDWRMATRTAEPRRITTLVYNGQPDPFNGNAVASCAPASALLPDGNPIVVLCKRVEQATTDDTGAQGFDATLQSGVPARTTSWTYDATGQVLTETDPRGKVVVTNEYYTDTTAEHTKGDLKSSMNSAGHLTQFPRYNAYGKPLEVIDANMVSTTYAYDARQRLTSVSTGGSTTSYEYWPTGLLKKTTQPDGAVVTYEYDDAHRLTAVADGQGNRIEYTLDQSGNRTAEVAKDPQSTLKRSMSRVFDALGRAQQTTGRE